VNFKLGDVLSAHWTGFLFPLLDAVNPKDMPTVGIIGVGHELQADDASQILVTLLSEVLDIQTLIEGFFHVRLIVLWKYNIYLLLRFIPIIFIQN